MSPPHIIRRQLVELRLPQGADGRAVQERVSHLCREAITALLDEHLSRHTGPEPMQLARIELDLGTIALPDLERELPVRLADELRRVLPPSVLAASSTSPQPYPGDQRTAPETAPGKDHDLLAYFLRSGLLPWWATPVSYQRVADAFTRAQTQDAGALKRLLTQLLEEPVASERLFIACQDSLLEQLLGLWLPVAPPDAQQLKAAMLGTQSADQQHAASRSAWWYALYKTVADNSVASGQCDAPPIYRMLTNFMATKGIGLPVAPAEQGTLELLAKIFRVKNAVPAPAGQPTLPEPLAQTQPAVLRADAIATRPDATDAPLPCPPAGQFVAPKDGASAQQDNSKLSLRHPPAFPDGAPALPKSLQQPALEEGHVWPGAAQSPLPPPSASQLAALGKEEVWSGPNELPLRYPPALPAPERVAFLPANRTVPAKEVDAFNDSDKISIQNTGLVLLWPFLPLFFARLGLVSEGRFKDGAAATRACLLLQYLVAGTADDYFEAALPLNKLLCGMELAQPLPTAWVIRPEEADAATALLEAVIQNGPLWRTLSVEGFRQAFLQREGLLSARDGHWLLQAARKTHDIIIDRLPWMVRHVKLPWMEHLLFTEWQQT